MGFRDRFLTPRTARAILSWRILLGLGAGIVLALVGLPVPLAVAGGVALYAASVGLAMPRPASRPSIDPFTLGEPWRQLVQQAQSSSRRFRDTVRTADEGPLRGALDAVADQVDRAIEEAWAIARRGDEIDDAVRRLDPTALRSRLATAEHRSADRPGPDADAAVESIRRQLESAERLRQQADDTAAALWVNQGRLDELVAQANEVLLGAADTAAYGREVDDLVIRLEALHRAVEETRTA